MRLMIRLPDRHYFTLRRLHSLSGLVPIGVFLAEHFLTNSFAVAGEASYNSKVEFLRSLPYLYLLEIFGIFLPILFHAVLGVLIYLEARFNSRVLNYRHNFMFTLQRLTGLFLIVYITYHVLSTRFAHWFGVNNRNLFELMEHKLQNPAIFGFYVVGVLAASFHLGNGLWGFMLHWGILRSREAQKRWMWPAMAVVAIFALTGVNSLLAFGPMGLEPVRIFQEAGPHHGEKAQAIGNGQEAPHTATEAADFSTAAADEREPLPNPAPEASETGAPPEGARARADSSEATTTQEALHE